jgi:hypothetical protein
MNRRLAAIAAAVITAASLLSLAPASARAAAVPPSAARSAAPAKPGPRGAYVDGPIRLASTSWCVTAPRHAVDGSPLFMAQCVKGDAYQWFHCTNFRGIGECSMAIGETGLDIGQYGKNDSRVKVINPDEKGRYNYVLGYVVLQNDRYEITAEGYGSRAIAAPVKLVKDHVFPLHWFLPTTRGYKYAFTFNGKWKEDPLVAAAASAPVKPGPRGANWHGLIRDLAHPTWCVMSIHDPKAGDPMILGQCSLEGHLKWFGCTMFRGIGGCALPLAPSGINIGQKGNDAVRGIDPDKGAGARFILDYVPLKRAPDYNLRLQGTKLVLSMPLIVRAGRVYPVIWAAANAKDRTAGVILGKWELDPLVRPAQGRHVLTA